MCGQGEWHSQKHEEKKVKRWKKLNIGVDDQGQIIASKVTESNEQDPLLALARNFTTITGSKVGQGHSRTQLSIDALSQKKGAAQLLGVILAFNSPIQFLGIGGFESVSVANGSSQGENLRVVYEPVGDLDRYRVEIALFSASAKGHHVAFVWHRSLIMWEKGSESCRLRER